MVTKMSGVILLIILCPVVALSARYKMLQSYKLHRVVSKAGVEEVGLP